MKKKHPDDDKRFVVYTENTGRNKKGIYCRHVRVVKDKAFVLPEGASSLADMVPKANVFDTHAEAERYLAGKGVKRWVVGEFPAGDDKDRNKRHLRHDIPMMFEGFVVYYHYAGRHRNENRFAVKRSANGRLVEVHRTHGLETFESEKEAEKHFKYLWNQRMKEIQEYAAGYQSHLAELFKRAPDGELRPFPVVSQDILLGALIQISILPNNNALRSERGNKAVKLALDTLAAAGLR